MNSRVRIGKYKVKTTFLFAVIAVVLLIAGIIIGAAAGRRAKRKEAEQRLGGSFNTLAFEDVTDAECLRETLIVFTDSSGKKGVMMPDGEITEQASQKAIYTVNDAWRSYRFVCEGSLSEYRLLIDPETGKITSRQYHGVTVPERDPVWSETGNHLAWVDGLGYAGEVVKSELGLAPGLYPVANKTESGAKFGFIDENLNLEIALLYDGAGDFSEGLAPVKKNGKWGYINEKGLTAIQADYDAVDDETGAYTFRNGLAPVCKGGLFGIINRQGETVVAFEFEKILQGRDGKYVARKNGAWGLLKVDDKAFAKENTTSASTTQAAPEPVVNGNYRVVTAGSPLNLRATADINSAILARIPNGTAITVTKSVDGWAYTTYNSASGWVSADYIQEIAPPQTEPSTAAETSSSAA